MAEMKLTVYGDSGSGNCYKVKLALCQLRRDYDWVEIDILKGDTKTPAFRELNPLGKIPILVLPDGHVLRESNAILYYLTRGSYLLPDEDLAQAQVFQWMFFEQYSHEPCVATARFILKYLGGPEKLMDDLAAKQKRGYVALDAMEAHLSENDFMVPQGYSIADIALFAYTHVAGEGGFDLSGYPAIRAWLGRVEASDGFVPM